MSEKIDILKYREESFLGRGQFGDVYKYVLIDGSENRTSLPENLAIKTISVVQEMDKKLFFRELYSLTRTKHKNIVKFFSDIEKGHRIQLVLEFCNMNLKKLIEDEEWSGQLSQVRAMAVQIAKGIAYLHQLKIIHRDIKPGNVLLKFHGPLREQFPTLQNVKVKISDFGLSRPLEDGSNSSLSSVSTQRYMSPEMARASNEVEKFRSDQPYLTDVFSAGILFFEMRFGRLPFRFTDLAGPEIEVGELSDWEAGDAVFRDLCVRMMAWEAGRRVSMEEVLMHEFLV